MGKVISSKVVYEKVREVKECFDHSRKFHIRGITTYIMKYVYWKWIWKDFEWSQHARYKIKQIIPLTKPEHYDCDRDTNRLLKTIAYEEEQFAKLWIDKTGGV